MAAAIDIVQRREGRDKPLLKSHKVLPRRRDLVSAYSPACADNDTGGDINNGPAYPPTRTLPLTPPVITLEDQKPLEISHDQDAETHLDPQNTITPSNGVKPLTPDITPPRIVSRSKKRDGQSQRFPSASSRTTSFATAKESLSSDEETERSKPTSLLPSKHGPSLSWRNTAVSHTTTDEAHHDKDVQKPKQDRQLFDTNELQVRKRGEKRSSSGLGHTQSSHQEYSLSRIHHGSLRGRTRNENSSGPSNSVEAFAASTGWRSEGDMENNNSGHVRCISTASTTTIEAIVIDSPPQKKRTLRHTEKNDSLRSVSTPTPSTPSVTKPLQSLPLSQPRLTHKRTRITDENRWSIASDMSGTTTSTAITFTKPRKVEDVIRVVVIPQRRSSLKTTAPPRPVLRSLPPNHRRPSTAPDSAPESSQSSRRHRRTMSESLPSTSSVPNAFKPKIPTRRSSLSAPTSRNTSRAGSMSGNSSRMLVTAVGSENKAVLDSKALPQPPSEFINPQTQNLGSEGTGVLSDLIPKPLRLSTTSMPTPQIVLPPDSPVRDHEDSTRQPTPPAGSSTQFQRSIESLSCSPGPVEISQATAVPFFAHNNKSLLVVEHPLCEARPRPPMISLDHVESPLRYPRAAPKPPGSDPQDVPLIPLKRANTVPSRPRPPLPMQTDSSSGTGGGIARRLSLARRRFSSSNRASTADSIPATDAAKDIRSTTHRVRNRMAGKKLDSKKHPFWRPYGFWQDYDDEGISSRRGSLKSSIFIPKTTTTITAGNDLDSNGYESGQYVSNTLGIPHNRTPFQGPISMIRRVSQRSRFRSKPSRVIKSPSSKTSLSLVSEYRQGKRVRSFRPLHEVQDWIARTRQRREQEKLEARREKLRRAIGGNVIVDYTSVASTMDPESVFSPSRRERIE
ncbi:conserved hypothetical protein [Trichophyton verrucosum HKI 0517]|uniref:Uncharacterized protein n=1 Tax=Trichophyton verrucosum (strain HKI 0517) TaxID=663202 RepID=D4DBE8_TRIVH|nr:uncharacterized protein TRV_04448 [Trichophyton verrucosum HKI 0517]EFE40824.1 conserved hypothetical protein [Trichophyton verrucosum HKI 0517]